MNQRRNMSLNNQLLGSNNTSVTTPLMSKQSPGMDVGEEAISCSIELSNQSLSNEMESNHGLNMASPLLRAAFLDPLGPSDNCLVAEKQKREYVCKYCNKKFSKQQAYSGHQNGHKHERTIERNRQMANFRCVLRGGGRPLLLHGMNPSPCNFNWAIVNRPYVIPGDPMHHRMMPLGRVPYPLPAINQGYPGGQSHVLGNVTQFKAYPAGSMRLENQHPGIQLLPPRNETDSSFLGPILNSNPRVESSSPQINGPQNQQVEGDSGLDLSLKL